MPAEVPTLLFKGLAEGLTLHAAEREPTDEPGLRDRFEQLLGQRPHSNQIDSVLREVRGADYVRTPDGDGTGIHQLTQDGARRLEAYRRLPDALKTSLIELFRIPPELHGTDPPTSEPAPEPARSGGDATSWIEAALREIPGEIEVQAPYARVSFDRDPAGHAWTLRVERHQPGRYEGAQRCPLTFLYEAATRLVADARGPAVPAADG